MGMVQEQGQRSGQVQHALQEGQQQQQPLNPQPNQEQGRRLDQTMSLQQSLPLRQCRGFSAFQP